MAQHDIWSATNCIPAYLNFMLIILLLSRRNINPFFFNFRATGFTTRSDIGPARDANDVS